MTTQQQTDQPPELGERVAKLEGRFDELSPRIDTLQRSVDSLRTELKEEIHGLRTELKEEIHGLRTELRTEMQTGDASLREEIISLRASQESFRGTVILMLLGVWFTTVAGVGAAIVTQFVLN